VTRALVTGAAGQDGSYLVEQLLVEGLEVNGTVRPGQRNDLPAGVVLHQLDVRDTDASRRLILALQPDEVYHLAATSSVALSWRDPVGTFTVNTTGAVGVIEAAIEAQERRGRSIRFLLAGSSEAFGDAPAPQNEETPLLPLNPYGASKAAAQLAVGVARHRGLHASTAVLFNHESPRRPAGFVTRKITRAVARISLGLQDVLTLGNLDVERDWGFAGDYVEAMRLMLRQDEADDYVIATGEAHSLRDLLDVAFGHVGVHDWSHLVRQDPAFFRPAEANLTLGDTWKAREVLGWKPKVTFAELVRMMVDHDVAEAAHPIG